MINTIEVIVTANKCYQEVQDHCRRHWRTLNCGGNDIMIKDEDEWV